MRTLPESLRRPVRGLVFFIAAFAASGCGGSGPEDLAWDWMSVPDRPWPGPDWWANRLQDWQVREGRLWVIGELPMRTAHLLTVDLAPAAGPWEASIVLGISAQTEDREGLEPTGSGSAGPSAGLLLGAGSGGLDPRKRALIHHSPGPGGGVFVGLNGMGQLVATDFRTDGTVIAESETALSSTDSVALTARITHDPEPRLTVTALPLDGSGPPLVLDEIPLGPDGLDGGLALAATPRADEARTIWFSDVALAGEGLRVQPERQLGPILGAQHVIDRGSLAMTAQLLPLSGPAPGPVTALTDSVVLSVAGTEGWRELAREPVLVPGFTATFRIPDWDTTREQDYRLTLMSPVVAESGLPYQGTIRAEPPARNPDEFVIAAFTGNHNVASPGVDRGSFDWLRNLWFPHDDIVAHVEAHDPDFLFFSGDQVYEGASPTRADYDHPYQDYLYKWYLWLWAFRDLTADIPSVAIPDDHDVFHGNVWGAGGRATPPGLSGAEAQDQGGYRLPADWVNMVQRTQTSHLPTPWAVEPTIQGITNYYTDILYGGVSMAVLEDRKFKSPPKLLLPEAQVWNGWSQNPDFDAPSQADVPGAALLGPEQERFLESWALDWAGDAWMKVVLSQTIFGNVATIPSDASSGSVIPSLPIPMPGDYVEGDKMAADMDSNGWPQSGRDRAVQAMKKGFAVHLAGDQHLASTIQYGMDGFRNGPFALCVPSIANFWPRRWYPPSPGADAWPGAPVYAGDFLDGFGNPMTVHAVSNPGQWGHEPATLHNRAPGYGIARFRRASREVVLEAWPRWADPRSGGEPYPGWPVIFHQVDALAGAGAGFLPTIVVEGGESPVVQVRSEPDGEVVYALRMEGTRFTPRIPMKEGSYTLQIGEPGEDGWQTFLGLTPSADSSGTLTVILGESRR